MRQYVKNLDTVGRIAENYQEEADNTLLNDYTPLIRLRAGEYLSDVQEIKDWLKGRIQ